MTLQPELDTSPAACPSSHSTANKLGRVAWGIAWWVLFRLSPRIFYSWRVLVLKLFGARITPSSRIDPTVRIWAPWNLIIGKDSSIGHHVDVYNLAPITIGDNATVSQYSYLCSGSHDVTDPTMKLIHAPIEIEHSAWVCAGAFVGPGITVHCGAVVGARSVVTKDVSQWTIVAGNPAREIRKRELVQ